MLASLIDQLEHHSMSKDLAKFIKRKKDNDTLVNRWG